MSEKPEIQKEGVQEEPQEEKTTEAEKLKQKIQALEEEKKELWDRLLRLQAEFENYKKRSKKEMEAFKESAHEAVIKDVLYVLDNIERALEAAEKGADKNGLLEGMKLIHKQFKETLKRYGVEEIVALNSKFNPILHQAVMSVDGDKDKDDMIVQEIEKGYLIKGRLLRPSKVVVSKYHPPQEEEKSKES